MLGKTGVWGLAVASCLASAGAVAQKVPVRQVTGEVAVALAGPVSAADVSPRAAALVVAPTPAAVLAPASLAIPIAAPAAAIAAPPVAPAATATSALPPAVKTAPEPVPVFRVRAGETLSEVLTRWVGRGQMSVVWKSSNDYRLAADAHFAGGLPAALEQLTEVVAKTSPALRVRMYANGVIVVTEGAE